MADILQMTYSEMENLAAAFDKASTDLAQLQTNATQLTTAMQNMIDQDWNSQIATHIQTAGQTQSPLDGIMSSVSGSWQGDRYNDFSGNTYPSIQKSLQGIQQGLTDFRSSMQGLSQTLNAEIEPIISQIGKEEENCSNLAEWIRQYVSEHQRIEGINGSSISGNAADGIRTHDTSPDIIAAGVGGDSGEDAINFTDWFQKHTGIATSGHFEGGDSGEFETPFGGKVTWDTLKYDAGADASAGMWTEKDGVRIFNPNFAATATAGFTAFAGTLAGNYFGDKNFGAYYDAGVEVGKVEGTVGATGHVWDNEGNFDPKIKVEAKGEVDLANIHGETGFEILGVKVGVKGKGYIGAGAGAHAEISKDSIEIGAGVGLGIGGEVGLSIDMSDADFGGIVENAQSAWDYTTKKVDEIGQDVNNFANEVGGKLNDFANDIGGKINNAFHW